MIKITIEITDTPLPDGQFYGKIEAVPETVEPVSEHECQMRDMIMNVLQAMAKKFVESEGISKSIIARVPIKSLKKGGKDVHTGHDRRNPGTMR
jgi:hypothetical protein